MQHDRSPGGEVPSSPAWRRWLDRLPRPCVVCSQWDNSGLCRDCRQRFLNPTLARCPRCALPNAAGSTCGACLKTPPPFSHCSTVADYSFPWNRLIGRFKFQQQPELAGLLADLIADALARQAMLPRPDWVLPVPLSPTRLAERGYNQAWELARHLAARQGVPARASWLLRLRDTAHQVGLDRRARASNLHDAMWVTPEGRRGVAGCQLALVDDVMTTGVTTTAATHALLAAGATGVQVWVLARTPAPSG